jgi:hypothetical protein
MLAGLAVLVQFLDLQVQLIDFGLCARLRYTLT